MIGALQILMEGRYKNKPSEEMKLQGMMPRAAMRYDGRVLGALL